jgi:hypothetical protein
LEKRPINGVKGFSEIKLKEYRFVTIALNMVEDLPESYPKGVVHAQRLIA